MEVIRYSFAHLTAMANPSFNSRWRHQAAPADEFGRWALEAGSAE